MKTSLGLVPHLYSPVTSSLSFIHTYHNLHFVRLFVGFHLPIQTHESRDQAWFCFPFYLQSLAHSKHVVGAHYLLAAEFSELLPLSPWQPLTQLSTPTILKHSLPLLLDSSSSASPSLVSFFSLSHVGSIQTEFNLPQFVRPWTSYVGFLSVRFLICKRQFKIIASNTLNSCKD